MFPMVLIKVLQLCYYKNAKTNGETMPKKQKKKKIKRDPRAYLLRKITKGTTPFDSLDRWDQISVLEYLQEKKSITKIFEKRGFDVLCQLFFVYECSLDNDYLEIKKTKVTFCSFKEYFEYINGTIYTSACYYGYKFSNEEINEFSISVELLNFDSFINETIADFPVTKKYSLYRIKKYYKNNRFVVHQEWFKTYKYRLPSEEKLLDNKRVFDFFADYVHYLQGDLTNADFLMCDDDIANIKTLGLKIDGIIVRSTVAKELGIPLHIALPSKNGLIEFEESETCESLSNNEYMLQRAEDDDYSDRIAYISDIHLLHRYNLSNSVTLEDQEFINRSISSTIINDTPKTRIKLLGGDISSDYEIYKTFISSLSKCDKQEHSFSHSNIFFTLGNHELWPFAGEKLDHIEDTYRELLSEHDMYLVHNDLYYYEGYCSPSRISFQELQLMEAEELRNKLRSASLIIFGGTGFSGLNQDFNANQGIYRGVLSRENEIKESAKFEMLYIKVSKALFDKNVIVFTHMPMKDWSALDTPTNGFVFVSGHNHRNYYLDDGKTRIYADNQIGYKQKNVNIKHLSINMDYDWFSDYKDGIYEITREDYINFYRGIREGNVSLNREFQHLYMLKREGVYMFLMINPTGNLLILNGGSIKHAENDSLEYYYDNLVSYSKSIKLFLSRFDSFQKKVSKVIKSLGGYGTIHGCIVDIDSLNHLYLNPLDGTITPYFAFSMVNKFVFKNIASLLKLNCPKLFKKYEQLCIESKTQRELITLDNDLTISEEELFVESTEMYKISRILKGLQFTTKYNIVRMWSDAFVSEPSEASGRLIVSGLIDPRSVPAPPRKKKTGNKFTNRNIGQKPSIIKTDLSKKEQKYKAKVAEMTQTIEVLCYNGIQLKSEYRCALCGHTWKETPPLFKANPVCPNCKK